MLVSRVITKCAGEFLCLEAKLFCCFLLILLQTVLMISDTTADQFEMVGSDVLHVSTVKLTTSIPVNKIGQRAFNGSQASPLEQDPTELLEVAGGLL